MPNLDIFKISCFFFLFRYIYTLPVTNNYAPCTTPEEIMEKRNTTSDFILLGLFKHTGPHLFLFMLVLTMAIASLVGNALLLLLIYWDPRLHTPMYFLLSQLSLMDLMLVATIVPKMSADYLTGKKSISPAGCGLQIFVSLTLGGGEGFLLAAMSYDRFVAVCHPLRYPVLMSWQLCLRMTLGCWFLGAADGIMQAAATLSFPFCSAHEIDHFFCEAPMLVRLACANTSFFENVMYICCVLMLLVPFSLILTSYSLILSAVLQMHSREASKKAFVTCSSHLVVVGFFYGAAIFIYMRPKSYRSANHDKLVSAFYTIFTPELNPLIYSLRNSEVKVALKKWLGKCANLKCQQA
ncbi:olfactory receptor 2T33-like [Diceros bicornis minor]|uniref:olfactory receptor 2T33-like n=1 Tax=Diceros bicornis minor TaxID=77932 RepID=UPI0026F0694F|nr:olfactory receptor 2T33-like [Diceros bicornis minor]